MRRTAKADIVAILILLGIAAFFRLHNLHEMPIGLWRDEAANGLEALRVLDGQYAIFYGTREPMFIYLVALSVAFLGRTPLAIRLVSAIVGTATIPVTYLLVKELFRSKDHRARAIASLTSLWLATSYWHISFSRLGFRGILLPLVASLSFYFLWRGWNELSAVPDHGSSRRSTTLLWFALAGLLSGLTMYTYTAARFLPLVLLPFLGSVASTRWGIAPEPCRDHRITHTSASAFKAFAVFGLVFHLVFAPLGAYFVTHPGSFLARSGVSVFGLAHDEPLVVVLAQNAVRQLGMFGFAADPNVRHDPAGRPAFDLFTLSFFLLGAAVGVRRCTQIPYLFVLSWLSAMLLPAILTVPELPHFLRAIGALPAAYVFPALGVERAWNWLTAKQVSPKRRSVLAGVLALYFAVAGFFTYRDYFAPVLEEIELTKAFDPRFVEAASIMNRFDEPDSVWIIPVGPEGEQRMAYFVIDFLYQGKAAHSYVSVDEATACQELSQVGRDKERAMVLKTTSEYEVQPWFDLYADTRQVIISCLDEQGRHAQSIRFDGFEVVIYQLPENLTSSLAHRTPRGFCQVRIALLEPFAREVRGPDKLLLTSGA